MRPPAVLLFFLALGCASAELANAPTDSALDAGDGDGGWSGGGLGPSSAVSGSGDDASASPVQTSDPSQEGGEGEADALDDAVDESPAGPEPPFDPGEGGVCSGPLAPGDLVIDELMIESVGGAGDHGEWLEVTSTLPCAVDLRGLHGTCPNGAKVRTFVISEDIWIPGLGTFIVADSNVAAINHNLPGTVVVWSGQPGDVLRNKGDTVTLLLSDVVIDSLTYPSMTWTAGASLEFASACAPARRSDWAAWQLSAASFFPGFYGTPNAPNDDVPCP
jgi:hypothetical protein